MTIRSGAGGSGSASIGRKARGMSSGSDSSWSSVGYNLVATGDYGFNHISWNHEVGGKTGYILERSTDGTIYTELILLPDDEQTYNDYAITPGTTYWYRVRSITLGAPSNLSASTVDEHTVNLTWSDNSTHETGYVVDKNGVQTVEVGAGVTSYSSADLYAGVPTNFRVKAVLDTRSSAYSNSATGTAASAAYHYGYPAYGTSQPHVKAQWTMDSTSPDDIIDSVSGLSLAVNGTPTYRVFTAGDFAGCNPGITYAASQWHANLNRQANLDIGASDNVVIEAVASWNNGDASGGYLMTLHGNEPAPFSGARGLNIYYWTDLSYNIWFRGDDDTLVNSIFSGVGYNDGLIHKYRIVLNRSGNCEMFIDGISLGTNSLAGVSGKVITCQGFRLAGQYNAGVASWKGTIYELRISIGTDVLSNNSGGPGGG